MQKLRTDRSIMQLLIAYLVTLCLPILIIWIGGSLESIGVLFFGLVLLIILLIAFFVFWVFYFNSVCKDLNTLFLPYEPDAKDMSATNWIAIMFLPFYGPYWWFRQGNRLWYRGKKNYDVSLKETGSTYCCWMVLADVGITIGLWIWLIDSIHQIVTKFQEPGLVSLIGLILGIAIASVGLWIAVHKFLTNLNMVCSAYNNGYGKKDPCPYECKPVIIEKNQSKPEPRQKRKGSIVCTSGLLQGAVVDIQDGQEIIIGREGSVSNLVISDPHVSKKHCGVRYSAAEDRYYITDYSTNGLYYKNGQRFVQNIATSCPKQTVFVLGKTNNEFLVK